MFHEELPIIHPEYARCPLGAVDEVFELTIYLPKPDIQVRVRVMKNWVCKCLTLRPLFLSVRQSQVAFAPNSNFASFYLCRRQSRYSSL